MEECTLVNNTDINTLIEDISECKKWPTPEEILKQHQNVVVFGTGQAAQSLNDVLANFNVNILYYVDNNEDKHGTDFFGKKVESPIVLLDEKNPVLIASFWARDIAQQLHTVGCNYFDFSFCVDFERWKNHFDYQVFNIEKAVRTGKKYLTDNDLLSYLSCLRYRQTYDPLYLSIPHCNHYMHDQVMPLSSDVYIDGGAWQGDTLLELKELVGNDIEVHSFEPDNSNFNHLKNLVTQKAITHCYINNEALWNKQTTLSFCNSLDAIHTMQARISNGSDSGMTNSLQVSAVTLDLYYQTLKRVPTYIKLDIEGAEPEALEGATKLIKTAAPKLAISAYHEPNHIWELIEQIASLNSNYQFFFVHHSQHLFESVIYSKEDIKP